jgi:septum formation protein
MLTQAGLPIDVQPADLDDGRLAPGRVSPEAWVMALAYLKARRVAELLQGQSKLAQGGTIIGADTVCINEDEIFGQPRDAEHARSMIRMMRNRTHTTVTGVALLHMPRLAQPSRPAMPKADRLLFFDSARVTLGSVTDEEIDRYIASGEWRGKAGGYNLSERIDAGWPIQVEGDPATVMGLPLQRLLHLIHRASPAEHPS